MLPGESGQVPGLGLDSRMILDSKEKQKARKPHPQKQGQKPRALQSLLKSVSNLR